VSTPAQYAQAVVQSDSAMPSMSTALVPMARDDGPRLASPGTEKPVNAHRLFYGVGYLGLGLVWAGMWLSGFVGPRAEGLFIVGGMFVMLGGFGILIHTLYRPKERKLRHLLLAIGSLALTAAASGPVERISREWYATAAVERLQPLADALAKDARIREIGVTSQGVVLNDFEGRDDHSSPASGGHGVQVLADALARDGVSRVEYDTYQRSLERVEMSRAQRTSSTVAFCPMARAGSGCST
jgi:hypothetical protein